MVDASSIHVVSGGPLRGSDPEVNPDHAMCGPQGHPYPSRLGETEQDFIKQQRHKDNPTTHGVAKNYQMKLRLN